MYVPTQNTKKQKQKRKKTINAFSNYQAPLSIRFLRSSKIYYKLVVFKKKKKKKNIDAFSIYHAPLSI